MQINMFVYAYIHVSIHTVINLIRILYHPSFTKTHPIISPHTRKNTLSTPKQSIFCKDVPNIHSFVSAPDVSTAAACTGFTMGSLCSSTYVAYTVYVSVT